MAGAGRVIAGTARGARLVAPGEGTRPLADRAKQTVFAILEPDLPDARFLDLFAGSGAGGIEALSRGAGEAVFVELAGDAVAAIRANLERTGFAGQARIVRADVPAWLGGPGRALGPFDIVLVDPPYPTPELLARTLDLLGSPEAAGTLLAPDARVVARSFWRRPPPERAGLLASERQRRLGESVLAFYRPAPGLEDDPA